MFECLMPPKGIHIYIYIYYIYICVYIYMYIHIYAFPPKIDHFLCFEKDAVHYCKKQMRICWWSTFKRSVVEDGCKIAHLPGLQHCKALQNCSPWHLKFQNFKSFQDTAQAKLPNYRPGKASLLNCRHCRPWLQNRLGRASAPTLQGFAKLQPLPNLQGSNTARLSKQVC